MTSFDVVPPNSKEAEMLVLGSMLLDEQNLKIALDDLIDSDFYFKEHKTIFQTLKTSLSHKKNIDTSILCEELKRQNQLQEIGGHAYILTLAQYAGTSVYVEEYIEIIKRKSLQRRLLAKLQEVGKSALEESENPFLLIEKLQDSLKSLEMLYSQKMPIQLIEERLKQLNDLTTVYRGKKYLGLRVKTIEEFNENLLGLRKLNLLAAAPNVGKTALTIQLAIEILLMEKEACLAYFSLEMSSLEIFTRMHLYLSELNFRNFIFGSQSNHREDDPDAYFKIEEIKKIRESNEILRDFGERLQIIDSNSTTIFDARMVINYLKELKRKTGCKRSIVIIDYLQVWPINPSIRFLNENEVDKWRIGEMKKIRDFLGEDPLIVISEARKPSSKEEIWGGDLSDVMGSARGTYTPDVVMLLSQLKPKALANLWSKFNMPKIELDENIECAEDEKPGTAIKQALAKNGISICKLEIPKARDGMQKFSILLEFHFHKNIFKKINLENLRLQFKKPKTNSLNFN